MARLGEAFPLIRNGASIKQTDGAGGYPITRIETIANREVDRSKFGYADINDLGKYEDYLLHDGDILMSHINSEKHLGKVALYRSSGDEHILHGMNLLLLRADTQVVLPSYAAYFFNSDAFLRQIPNITKKSVNQASFTVTALKELNIPLPSLDAQVESVKKLDMLSNLISLRKQQLAKLDELVKARFVELFGDPMTNSKGYVLKKYGDLFELNAGGTPSRQKTEYWDNGTISWIGSNMCQNTVIYENDGNYITEEGLKHSSARMFPVDTVLIALVGATIGKTALLKFETTTNQNVLGVRGIRENGYTPEFLFYYTQGLYQKFLSIGDGGFSMASKGFISELPVPVVDLALQEQFSSFVEQTDKSKLTVQQSLDKLELLKKALMQKYFA